MYLKDILFINFLFLLIYYLLIVMKVITFLSLKSEYKKK